MRLSCCCCCCYSTVRTGPYQPLRRGPRGKQAHRVKPGPRELSSGHVLHSTGGTAHRHQLTSPAAAAAAAAVRRDADNDRWGDGGRCGRGRYRAGQDVRQRWPAVGDFRSGFAPVFFSDAIPCSPSPIGTLVRGGRGTIRDRDMLYCKIIHHHLACVCVQVSYAWRLLDGPLFSFVCVDGTV